MIYKIVLDSYDTTSFTGHNIMQLITQILMNFC